MSDRKTVKDGKGSRSDNRRASKSIKRKPPPSPFEMEKRTRLSSSAMKLKDISSLNIEVNQVFSYRILNFYTVFTALSEYIQCNVCQGKITFSESALRGIGFKILVKCDKCGVKSINSCPLIGHAYEVNRRFVFAMRILGVGLRGAQKFCALMELPRPIFQSFYDSVINNIHSAVKIVCDLSLSKAAEEEKKLTRERENKEEITGLTVSGDGSWRKRGFSSLYGVSTLIGNYSGKILDILVKCSYCKACEHWETRKNTPEYLDWAEKHAENCSINHEGSAGKMEVDAIIEMFQRSEKLHEVKYVNYVGDGDSKTFKGITEAKPYGDDITIAKKECINHVKKRMGTRLRNIKKEKKLGGKGKLTDNLIIQLSNYYGLAIKNNNNSIENLKKAIWATYFHKCSSDDNPQHDHCPEGENSWCSWQVAKATGQLADYAHKNIPLHVEVQIAIYKIYEDLSRDELLQRCLGGFTQNANESVNALIWKIAPKILSSGIKIVEIAAFLASCLFNDGMVTILHAFQLLDITIGPNLYNYCMQEDRQRIRTAKDRTLDITYEEHYFHHTARSSTESLPSTSADVYYGPGIDD